jgi:acyl-coenzyme A thioesterase PaaI-like protein
MANCFYRQGQRAYTVKIEVRFKRACPTGKELKLEARIVEQRGRFATAEAEARLEDGTVVAEARGTFSIR